VATGTVKWFNPDKGYGFIAVDGGRDVFVHFSSIVSDGYRALEEGQRVEFDLTQTDRGLQAEQVRVDGLNVAWPANPPMPAAAVDRPRPTEAVNRPRAEVVVPGTPLEPGDPSVIGRHALLSRLGQGSMGTVYLARGADGVQVALKVIRPEWARDERFLRRFRAEALLASRVDASYTAKVTAVSVDSDPPYLATEFVEGPTLEDEIARNGPLSGPRAKALAIGTAAALIAIHDAGIIHRDLKPSNVMLSRYGPRVIDFGIARSLGSTTRLTQVGGRVGAPAYMSPEQIEDSDLTTASDVFSWAGTMVYAATGHQPFGSPDTNLIALYRKVLEGEPDLGDVPQELRPPLSAALAKDPAGRPTARQLLASLTGQTAR
jgi:eukaryotic-like serine/threonine-protein kinase